jgi:hypothetical protein
MKAQRKQISDTDCWKGFYTIFAFFGLILMCLEIPIYRNTFIKIGILLFIVLFIGVITFFLSKTHYKKTYNLKGVFFPLLQSILSWGFISSYLFLATNFYFADKDSTEHILKIKSKSSIPGARTKINRQPTAKFDYSGFEKEIVFYYSDSKLVDKAESIKLHIRKGALGFDIIGDYAVINK